MEASVYSVALPETDLNDGARRFRRGLRTGSRMLTLMAVSGAMAFGVHADQARSAEPVESAEPAAPLTHPVEIGVQDEAMIRSGDHHLAKIAINKGQELKAIWLRAIVYPEDVEHRRWKKYDLGIKQAIKDGYHIHVTLAASRKYATNKRVARYTGRVAKHFKDPDFKGEVKRFTLYNEPNQIGLEPQTYRRMYTVGYKTIKKFIYDAEIEFGGLSSKNYPLVYLHKTLLCPKTRPNCPPIKTFRLAYHPYRFTKSPVYKVRLSSWRSRQIGIDQQPLIIKRLKVETKAGRLETTEDIAKAVPEIANSLTAVEKRTPRIDYEEFGYSSYSRGKMASYNISNRLRGKYSIQVLKKVCADWRVAKLSFYQLVRSPARHLWPGLWDTSMVSQTGRPDSPFKRIRAWLSRHRECVKQS